MFARSRFDAPLPNRPSAPGRLLPSSAAGFIIIARLSAAATIKSGGHTYSSGLQLFRKLDGTSARFIRPCSSSYSKIASGLTIGTRAADLYRGFFSRMCYSRKSDISIDAGSSCEKDTIEKLKRCRKKSSLLYTQLGFIAISRPAAACIRKTLSCPHEKERDKLQPSRPS